MVRQTTYYCDFIISSFLVSYSFSYLQLLAYSYMAIGLPALYCDFSNMVLIVASFWSPLAILIDYRVGLAWSISAVRLSYRGIG